MNNPKGAMAHGSIRQLFAAQPKLTDEQRAHINRLRRWLEIEMPETEKSLSLLISSEQAWREEVERLQIALYTHESYDRTVSECYEEIKCLESENAMLKRGNAKLEKKLNQAVEDLELRESEYQSAISKANVASKLVREYQVRLKQAVDLLKFIARRNTQFPSWSATLDVLVDVRKLAAEFVSSLSEQEDKP